MGIVIAGQRIAICYLNYVNDESRVLLTLIMFQYRISIICRHCEANVIVNDKDINVEKDEWIQALKTKTTSGRLTYG